MIFHIYGTDAYLCRLKLEEMKRGFIQKKDKAGLNIISLDADDLDIDRFRQEALTVPFLSEKKLLAVNGLMTDQSAARKKFRAEILQFLLTHPDLNNNLLFFDVFEDEKKIPTSDGLFKLLLKQSPYSWFCPKLKNRELAAWLKKFCAKNQFNLAPQAISELVVLVGDDLVQLVNELAKLQAYKNGGQIEADDVRLLVKAKYDSDVFRLTDALAAQNRPLALELLSCELSAGVEPLALLGSINWQFKSLLKIKAQLENNPRGGSGAISAATGLHSYVVGKNLAAAKKFKLAELISILNNLLEMEKKLKTGHKNPELLFDLFIAQHC